MTWLSRLGWLLCVSCLLSLGAVGCLGVNDVGKSCELTIEGNKESLKKAKENNENVRIAERTFDCELPVCIANFADANNPDRGYCTRICATVADCPDSTNYTCEVYFQVEKLPAEHASFSQYVGEKFCLRIPPQQQPQGNQ